MEQIVFETYGKFALFTRPESKVERLTYPVPTPSAIRGLLAAIYSKPVEFYWQVNRIEVLNDIQFISLKLNEVKYKAGKKPILVEDTRTQRNSTFLRDVRYRIYASIKKRPGFDGTLGQLYEQAQRRIKQGKCYFQPCFGTRECTAYFEEIDMTRKPIDESLDVGIMLYDVYDLNDFSIGPKPSVSVYEAKMINGVIEVPDFNSPLVKKEGK